MPEQVRVLSLLLFQAQAEPWAEETLLWLKYKRWALAQQHLSCTLSSLSRLSLQKQSDGQM